MKNKGQVNLGIILLAFIGVIIGLALMTSVASSIGESTTIATLINTTYTVPAANGSSINLEGQELLSTPTVVNTTGQQTVVAGYYTIEEGVSPTTGVKSILFYNHASNHTGADINISYTYGPDGYIENSGARSIVGLILIFMGLAIAIVALTPALRSGVLDAMGV